jgi:hypothetical protein
MRTIVNHTQDTALNVGNLILGAILFLSPWLLAFRAENGATWNAWITGGVIGIVALMAAFQTYDWEEWVNLIAGLWALVSPWALGFSGVTHAMWTHVAVGIIVAVLAGGELWRLYGSPEARSV